MIQAVKDKRGKLQAFKLSELRIFISDGADQPISGVLVSVTGGDFRSNNFTGDSGRLTYIGLVSIFCFVFACVFISSILLHNISQLLIEPKELKNS